MSQTAQLHVNWLYLILLSFLEFSLLFNSSPIYIIKYIAYLYPTTHHVFFQHIMIPNSCLRSEKVLNKHAVQTYE